MKKTFALVLFLGLVCTMFAQPKREILLVDTLRNSEAIIMDVNTDKYTQQTDSITFSVYSYGACSIDSLGYYLGSYDHTDPKGTIKYLGNNVAVEQYGSYNSDSIGVSSSTGSGTYKANALTLTKAQLKGYNRVRLRLAAHSSGNTGTEALQKAVVIATYYLKP